WLQKRSGGEKEERAAEIVRVCSASLPTRAIAAILGVAASTVHKRQKALKLHISRSSRRKLEHTVATALTCPVVEMLNSAENKALQAEWQAARRQKREADSARRRRSSEYGGKLLMSLRERRQALN